MIVVSGGAEPELLLLLLLLPLLLLGLGGRVAVGRGGIGEDGGGDKEGFEGGSGAVIPRK